MAIFGSYAREEEKPESDIDVLVEFSKTKGLLPLSELRENYLIRYED